MEIEHSDLWLEVLIGRFDFDYNTNLSNEITKITLEDVNNLLDIIKQQKEDLSIQIYMSGSQMNESLNYNKTNKK